MSETATRKGKSRARLTPRQRKLIALIPLVESGEIPMTEAMKRAGYSENTANQQTNTLGALRNNREMQEALAKAGFTKEYLATGIVQGTKATEGKERVIETEQGTVVEGKPDYRARALYYKLGAELMDVFPSQKIQKEEGKFATYDDLENGPKAKSPQEALKMAEEMPDEDDE